MTEHDGKKNFEWIVERGTSHEKFFNDIESGKKGEWECNNLDVEDRNW